MMTKTITIEVAGSTLEIVMNEWQGDMWTVSDINLPKLEVSLNNGIWEDEAIFDLSEKDSSEKISLRIPTPMLVSLIERTRELVEDDNSWWFEKNKPVREKLKTALGLDQLDILKEEARNQEEKILKLQTKKK